MQLSRRTLLATAAGAASFGFAGCYESEVSTPRETESPANGRADHTPTPVRDKSVELGEGLVYSEGENKELSFSATGGRVQDIIISAGTSRIRARTPENPNHSFLMIEVVAQNTGSERIRTPQNLIFSLGGQQYEPMLISPEGIETFPIYSELLPGNSASGVLIFEIPVTDSEGQLVVDFSIFGTEVTGRWNINPANLEQISHDFTEQELGNLIRFGTETVQYELGAISVSETHSYSYSLGDFEQQHEAGEGNKFLLVDVVARNTGDESVYVPTRFSMRLVSGNSQYEPGSYRKEDGGYEGGEISPGVQREGVVLFEVPESISEGVFKVELTTDVLASWMM